MNSSLPRRKFIKLGIVAAGSAAFALTARTPLAAGLPHVSEADQMAQGLGYREDAKKVDAKKYPAYKPGELCVNCKLYQERAGDAWGPCQIFPGKDVSAKGWCTAYQKKA